MVRMLFVGYCYGIRSERKLWKRPRLGLTMRLLPPSALDLSQATSRPIPPMGREHELTTCGLAQPAGGTGSPRRRSLQIGCRSNN
jgi:hypothetical protein